MSARSRGTTGPQVPHHQAINSGIVGQGSGAVTMGDLCTHLSSLGLGRAAAPPGFPRAPFPLWSLPSPVIAICAEITLGAPPGQGPGLPHSPQPPGPGTVCAQRQPVKGCPLGKGVRWSYCPHHDGLCAHSASIWSGRVPSGARPGLGPGLVLSGGKEPVSAGRPDAPETPSPSPPPGPSGGTSVPPPSPGTNARAS